MFRNPLFRMLPLLLLVAELALSGCSALFDPVIKSGTAPTPVQVVKPADTNLEGAVPYQNDALGYSLYVPKDAEVSAPTANEVMILAAGSGEPGVTRAAAFIFVDPAEGRSVEQVVEENKAGLGQGFNITTAVIRINDAQAIIVQGLPGQDVNRQVFIVRNGLVYHLMFIPDDPKASAYQPMQALFVMVMNTLKFTR